MKKGSLNHLKKLYDKSERAQQHYLKVMYTYGKAQQ